MKYKLLIFLFSFLLFNFINSGALAQCSATTAPTTTSGCTREYFSQISASGTGITSTIAISGLTSCSGFDFPDYSGRFAMGVSAASGNTVTLNLTRLYNPGYIGNVTVWIDWNNDNIYQTTELAGTAHSWPAGSAAVDSVMTYSFIVPSGAVTATHLHMRLFLYDNSGTPPCYADYGQSYEFWFMVNCTPPVVTLTAAADSMCLGWSGIPLTGSWAGTGGVYTWAPSAGLSSTIGATVIATPSVTTVYTVTGTSATGCFDTASTVITINPPPSPISGAFSVCNGSSATLSNLSGGGTWMSNDITIATIDTNSGVFTGVDTGSVVITYTLATGCTATAQVTVNQLPSVISGPLVVCPGDTTSVSDSLAGGTWSSSNTAVATINSSSGIINGMAAGTATISYLMPTGCLALATLTVNPLPAPITGTAAICAGFSTTLNDATPGGSWSSSDTTKVSIGLTAGSFTAVTAGTAIITYTLATGCIAITTFTVYPGPAPITGTPRICTGNNITLADATTGGTWSSNNTAVATIGSLSAIVNGISPGIAIITYSTSAACPAIVSVSVFPVPASVTGPATVCVQAATTLHDAVSGGIWSSPGFSTTGTINAATGVFTGIAAGTAIITYDLAAGCLTTTSISVLPIPAIITGTTHICPGQSTTLGDISPSGAWTNSGSALNIGSVTGIVTGVSAGTSVISYTIPNGCFVTTRFTVNPLPVPISGTTHTCVGLFTTLTDATGGGNWSSPGTSGIATVGSSTGKITGVSAGTLVITYSLPTGCFSITTYTVNPIPSPISGALHVCAGLTTTLTDMPPGGAWSKTGTAATIGSSSGIVTGISAGTVIITYKSPAGCIIPATLTVNPLPLAISGSSQVCAGSQVSLSDLTGGGLWSASNGNCAIGSSSGFVTGINAGTSVITYTLPTGCIAAFTESVNPLPQPISGPLVVCQASSITLTDATGGGSWSTISVSLSIGAGSGIVSGLAPGTSTVTYTLPTGCSRDTVVLVNPLPDSIMGIGYGVCLGFNTNLNDSTAGGVWSDPGGTSIATISSSGLVTGLSVGTVTISYKLPTGCFVSAPLSVNPIPPAISGAANVCERFTTTLSDAFTGGSWTSSATSIALIDTFSGIATGVLTGTTLITFTSVSGCITTKSLTVILSPSPISGPDSVCTGSVISLSDASTGGAWSTSASISIAVLGSTGSVSGVSSGAVVISYTINTGCYSTQAVAVDQLPAVITGLTTVCAGSNITLSDSIPSGYWNSSMLTVATVDSVGIVTGVSAGSAIITYATGPACTALFTVTVLPVLAPVSGLLMVCNQSSITLTDATPGGAWVSENTGVAIVGSTGIVTGESPGTVIITYTVPNTCGIGSTTITVNPLPDAGTITGPNTLCTGSSVLLTDLISGGAWSLSSSGIATISATGLLTGISTGSVIIDYSITNICGTAVAPFPVTVNQTPDSVHIITYPATLICDNTLFQNFGASTPQPPGVFYTWSAFDAVIYATSANKQNCLVNFLESGHGWVKLSSGTNGTECYATDSIPYSISTLTSTYPNVIYYAPELICNDNTANSYQWGFDDATTLDSSLIPGAVNQNYYLPNPDFINNYYWVMTEHNGCLQKAYYNAPASVNTLPNNPEIHILVYPNPAETKIDITITGIVKSVLTSIKIYDISGKEVIATSLSGNKGSISLAGLVPGAYWLMAANENNRIGSVTFIKN